MDDAVRRVRRPTPAGVVTSVALMAVIVLAWLRIVPAWGPSSLWLDDAWPALAVRASGVGEALHTTVTAPGFTLLLTGWLHLVGFSERAAQALPLLFALAVGPVLYLAARRLWPKGPAALVAATLAAMAPLTITYATRVKPYTLDVLLCAVLVGVAASSLHGSNRSAARWRLTVVGLASIMFSAAVVGMAAGAVGGSFLLAVRRRPADADWWSSAILGPLLAFLAGALTWWLAVLRGGMHEALREYWSAFFLDAGDPVSLPMAIWRGAEHSLEQVTVLPVVIAVLAILLGIWVTLTATPGRAGQNLLVDPDDVDGRVMLLVLIVAPWLASLVLALAHLAPWGGGRTDSALVVPTALAMASVFGLATGRIRAHAARVTLAAAYAAFAIAAPHATYPVEDLRGVVTQLEAQQVAGDVTVVQSAARWGYALYTSAPVDLVEDASEANGFVPVVASDDVILLRTVGRGGSEDLRAALGRRPARVWLVLSHERADHLVQLEDVLVAAGYERRSSLRADGARADEWVAVGPA